MNQTPVSNHPDVLDADEAVKYLRLDKATETPEAGRRLLQSLGCTGKIHPIKWAKKYLYAKPDLDRFVAAEIAQLQQPSLNVNDGNQPPLAAAGDSLAMGTKSGHKTSGQRPSGTKQAA